MLSGSPTAEASAALAGKYGGCFLPVDDAALSVLVVCLSLCPSSRMTARVCCLCSGSGASIVAKSGRRLTRRELGCLQGLRDPGSVDNLETGEHGSPSSPSVEGEPTT